MEKLIVGLDEAGRGPLAGPVVAAAVVLDSSRTIKGIGDSKQLSLSKRLALFQEIQQHAVASGIALATVEEIDRVNILQASMLAMRRAFSQIDSDIEMAWVDGTVDPDLPCETHTLIKGDSKREDIGAASILAKVTRDRIMRQYASEFPMYGFEKHKGYPTKAHIDSLHQYGPCEIHRRSFAPVREVLESEEFLG